MGSTSTTEALPDGALLDLTDSVGDVAAFLRNVALLVGRVVRDPRVPVSSKLFAASAAVYAVSPFDLLPSTLPVIGALDDVWLVARALRHLGRTAGYEVLEDHWPGSDEGFAAVLFLAGVSG